MRDTTELATPNLEARNGGAPVQFDYPTLDGQHLSTESLAGRVGVIAFLAAYDDASLAQARFLVALARHHAPRLNVALLFLDPEENRPLVEAFVASLKLPLPSAIADRATVAGNGPFEGLHHVPSIVILDRKGAEAFRNIGLIQERDIDAAVKEVEKR